VLTCRRVFSTCWLGLMYAQPHSRQAYRQLWWEDREQGTRAYVVLQFKSCGACQQHARKDVYARRALCPIIHVQMLHSTVYMAPTCTPASTQPTGRLGLPLVHAAAGMCAGRSGVCSSLRH
jgi:hypothetical protein